MNILFNLRIQDLLYLLYTPGWSHSGLQVSTLSPIRRYLTDHYLSLQKWVRVIRKRSTNETHMLYEEPRMTAIGKGGKLLDPLHQMHVSCPRSSSNGR
jgi:hypothetical protein